MRRSSSLALLHRRVADELGVVADDGEIVQRMHELHLAGNLERAREGDAHVAHRHRHGVAIDDHEAARRIDHEAGAAIVALGDAGDRIRHVEADAAPAKARALRRADRRACEKRVLPPTSGFGAPSAGSGRALPHARGVVAQAVVAPGTSGDPCARCARWMPLGSSTVEIAHREALAVARGPRPRLRRPRGSAWACRWRWRSPRRAARRRRRTCSPGSRRTRRSPATLKCRACW